VRIYLCGQKAFGAAVLSQLYADGHTVLGVSSPPFSSRSATNGDRFEDRMRRHAALRDIPWRPAGELRAEHIAGLDVDVIVCAHSHDFLGRPTREASRLGAIGYHPSLLPLHRGRDAVRWTVHQRERVTGGSVYWLDQNVDGGPIAAQQHVFVRPEDTAETLWRKQLMPLGVRLLCNVVRDLQAGRIVRVPQNESLATWEPSWSRPPIFRPELPRLGVYPEGFELSSE
jgi:methionyl-tRNA formyltransferase